MSGRTVRTARTVHTALALLLLGIPATSASAQFIVTTERYDPIAFDLVLEWLHTPGTYVHTGPDWLVSADISFIGVVGGVRLWHQETVVRHLVDLHAGERGGGDPLPISADFPDVGSFTFTIDRPHGAHADRYTHVVEDVVTGQLTRVEIHGLHVIPEPPTATLLGLGLGALVATRSARRVTARTFRAARTDSSST